MGQNLTFVENAFARLNEAIIHVDGNVAEKDCSQSCGHYNDVRRQLFLPLLSPPVLNDQSPGREGLDHSCHYLSPSRLERFEEITVRYDAEALGPRVVCWGEVGVYVNVWAIDPEAPLHAVNQQVLHQDGKSLTSPVQQTLEDHTWEEKKEEGVSPC